MSGRAQLQGRASVQTILEQDRARASSWLYGRGRRWLAVGLLASSLLAGLLWYGSDEDRVRYVTAPVARGRLTVVVTATGSVQPTNKVDVSSELSGTIRKVLVDYNSTVRSGQVLAELDTDKLLATVQSGRAKLAAAEAKVADAQATVTEKERDLARKTQLASTRAGSIEDLEQAQAAHERALAALDSARADVGVARAALQLDETNLTKACICAPIDGIVLRRNVDPGQTVASSFQAPVLFTIAEDLRQMELQVDVDEADVGLVRVGQSATFGVDAFPDRKFPASIRDLRYAAETIQGVVTYKALLAVDNGEQLLRPGMTATAEIVVAEVADALLIPNAALRYAPPVDDPSTQRSLLGRLLPGPPRFRAPAPPEATGPQRTVWVLTDGQPVPVTITIGASDGRHTQVHEGALQPGQALVLDQATAAP